MGDLSVGDRVEVEVGPIAHGGHCVARHEGRVLFVRHALPGERVVAEVTEGAVGDRFLRADAVEVLLASPDRVSAPCRYAGRCGGCDFQHVSLSAQRRLKAEVVGEQFARLARRAVDVAVAPVPGDREGLRWRTRAEFALDQDGRIGMHPHRSHEVLPVEDCLIAVEALVPALTTDEAYAGRTGLDVVSPAAGGTVIVPLPVVAGEAVPVVHESVAGQRLTRDFEVSARGFWQVHPGAAATFVDAALELLVPQPGETVLDLYSGVGVFTAALAEAVGPTGRVLAVESDAEATVHAKANCAAYQGWRWCARGSTTSSVWPAPSAGGPEASGCASCLPGIPSPHRAPTASCSTRRERARANWSSPLSRPSSRRPSSTLPATRQRSPATRHTWGSVVTTW